MTSRLMRLLPMNGGRVFRSVVANQRVIRPGDVCKRSPSRSVRGTCSGRGCGRSLFRHVHDPDVAESDFPGEVEILAVGGMREAARVSGLSGEVRDETLLTIFES